MQEEAIKLGKGLLIVSPWPVVYLENERAIVASDLHLGLEDKLEQDGISIPRSFLNQILESIIKPAKVMGASKIIFLEDVKGNHDNYIARILKEFNIPLYTPSVEAGGYILTHGHIDVKGKRLLIG